MPAPKWDLEEAVPLRGASRDTGRAMSQENVEIVRRFYEAGQRSLEAY